MGRITFHTDIEINPYMPGKVLERTANWLERLGTGLEKKNIFLHVLFSCAIGPFLKKKKN